MGESNASRDSWSTVQIAVLTPVFVEMKAQGRSAKWLAAQSGISEKSISHYRYGRRRMPPDLFERMRKALGNPPSLVKVPPPADAVLQRTRRAHPRRQRTAKPARGPPERALSSVSP